MANIHLREVIAIRRKVDYKRDYKHLYVPKTVPEIVDVPPMGFFSIDGEGDPNGPGFADATAALYSLAYAVRMSYKRNDVPSGYFEYTVFPLEGVWDLIDRTKPSTDKSNFKYTLMIRQPDFVTPDLFEMFRADTQRKKPNPLLDNVRFEQVDDGLSCQMMHLGSFDDEPASFARMEAYCAEQGYVRASRLHREIYLSDPRRTETAKLKTVLRFAVAKA